MQRIGLGAVVLAIAGAALPMAAKAEGEGPGVGIACSPIGGRIIGTNAAVVWVQHDGEVVAVTDDPAAVPLAQAAGADTVVFPDDLCTVGWILPAPMPGVDPTGGPNPSTNLPRPLAPRSSAAPLPAPSPNSGAPFARPARDDDPAVSAKTALDAASAAAATPADDESVVPATEEPTPTPAKPAERGIRFTPASSADGCSTVPGSGGSAAGLFGLLTLVGLGRRRQGGR